MDPLLWQYMLAIVVSLPLAVQERLFVISQVKLIMLFYWLGIILPIGLSRTLGGLTGVIMDLDTYPKQLIVE